MVKHLVNGASFIRIRLFVVYKMESVGDVKHASVYDFEVLELQFNIRGQNANISELEASGSEPRDGEFRLLPGAKFTSEISYR